MRANSFEQLARGIVASGAPATPTFLLVRELDVYDVEFAALEFIEEAVLPLLDWSALSLTRALGASSPRDVDAYLGLGEHVSKDLVLRLVDEKLLEFDSAPIHEGSQDRVLYGAAPEASFSEDASNTSPSIGHTGQESHPGGVVGFFRRLFAKKESPMPPTPAPVVRAWSDVDAKQALAPAPSDIEDDPLFDEHLAARAHVTMPSNVVEDTDTNNEAERFRSTSPTPEPRRRANELHESRADNKPTCRLTAAGVAALERGKTTRRRRRSMRLTFSVDPLHYLATVDEKRMRHTQHRRGKILAAHDVPVVMRHFDEVLSLEPGLRVSECGIETSIPGSRGIFAGVVPGEQWEVRPLRDKSEAAPLLVLAAFPTKDEDALDLKTYTLFHDELVERSHLEPMLLIKVRTKRGLFAASGLDATRAELLDDGAFRIRSEAADLPSLLGDADDAKDVYVQSKAISGWTLGTRVHAMPANLDAARAAFFEYLSRRDAALRRDFDRTCTAVAAMLHEYWGSEYALPSVEDAAEALWTRTEMRSALCMRRLQTDLVTPYVGANQ